MATTELSWNDVRHGVAKLCEERGWHHGVAMMSSTDPTRRVIMAKGSPLSEKHGHDVPVAIGGAPEVRVCSASDVNECQDEDYVVNTWHTTRKMIAVCNNRKGASVHKFEATTERFEMYLRTLLCQAGAVDSDAEFKAMIALRKRINDNQWDCYVLGNAFTETSERSNVTYIFRKGLPTIAMRCRPRPEGGETRHFLAALCSHPLAWFEGTHVGAYPPTDEVLANLLAVRADEHMYWRKSIQHTLDDPLAAI
jgi:hypothetical protein